MARSVWKGPFVNLEVYNRRWIGRDLQTILQKVTFISHKTQNRIKKNKRHTQSLKKRTAPRSDRAFVFNFPNEYDARAYNPGLPAPGSKINPLCKKYTRPKTYIILSRKATVLPIYTQIKLGVHGGDNIYIFRSTPKKIGHKVGEFVYTRKFRPHYHRLRKASKTRSRKVIN